MITVGVQTLDSADGTADGTESLVGRIASANRTWHLKRGV